MVLFNIIIGVFLLLIGVFIGSIINFDWEAFWEYRLHIVEMKMKEGGIDDRA